MQFKYYEHLGPNGITIYRPELRIIIRNGLSFVLVDAAIDTGADFTLLPIELATPLQIKLQHKTVFYGAGNNQFTVYKSPQKLEHIIRQGGHEQIKISSEVYFAESQPTILLGHKGFLEFLKITFDGPKRRLTLS